MEKHYWIGRKRAAMAMAEAAACAEARLIHYELAGRYSVRAANVLPFLASRKSAAGGGDRGGLELPMPAEPRPDGRCRPEQASEGGR